MVILVKPHTHPLHGCCIYGWASIFSWYKIVNKKIVISNLTMHCISSPTHKESYINGFNPIEKHIFLAFYIYLILRTMHGNFIAVPHNNIDLNEL